MNIKGFGDGWVWLYDQTAEGERIDLGRFDRSECKCAMLGDELYIRGDGHVGWCKFHLAHDVPECRPITFED